MEYEPAPFTTEMLPSTMPLINTMMLPVNVLLVVTFTIAFWPSKMSSTLMVNLRSVFSFSGLTSNLAVFESGLNA